MDEKFNVNGVDVRAPDFDKAGKVHDWRNYVGLRVRELWGTLTPAQQMAIAIDADDRAREEDWE